MTCRVTLRGTSEGRNSKELFIMNILFKLFVDLNEVAFDTLDMRCVLTSTLSGAAYIVSFWLCSLREVSGILLRTIMEALSWLEISNLNPGEDAFIIGLLNGF